MKHTQNSNFGRSKIFRKFYLLVFLVLSQAASILAHDITIANVTATKVSSKKAQITFQISWLDSWYYQLSQPKNHDAVWLFVKYLGTDGKWHHVQFNGYRTHTEADISVPSDKKGVFIRKKMSETLSDFEAEVSFADILLYWSLSAANLYPPQEPYVLKVFGIEMVYVPENAFYAGVDSIAGGDAVFYDKDSLGTEGFESDSYTAIMNPFPKTLINTGDATASGGFPQIDSSLQYLPGYASFPNGYKGFYCMKYEINLGQYVDFLNCLIPSGLDANFYTDPAIDFGHDCSRVKRYSIYFDDSLGQYVTNNPALPHEYVGWGDCMAYADWAALRPMSELEFEKVCRGPADVFEPIGLNYDYAYGVHEPVNEEYELALLSGNSTGEFDSVTNYDPQTANLVYRGSWFKYDFCEDEEGTELIGFMRNGVFANMATMRGDSLTRINTGGTYYGVMEMSGNLNERCVGISERWRSSSIDADTLTEDYDWPLNNTPSCGSTGISFEVLNMKGIKYYYKDCPSVFTGVNGDGELGADGKADVTGWPKEGKGGAPGSIIRGGRWNQIKERCYTADRLSLTGATARTHESTIRFVRTF